MTAPSKLTASIIIPTRGNPTRLQRCLESLYENTKAPCEVLVVFNGAAANNKESLRYVRARELDAPQKTKVIDCLDEGFVAAANRGFAKAEADHLILLHDDTVVPPLWLEQLLEAKRITGILQPTVKVGLVGPCSNEAIGAQRIPPDQYPEAGDPALVGAMAQRLMREGVPAGNRTVIVPASVLSTFCLLITRECFEATRGFDPRFGPGGGSAEHDLMIRAQAAGFLGLIANRAFVYHEGGVTLGKYYPGIRHNAVNLATYLEKHQTVKKEGTPTIGPNDLCIAYYAELRDERDAELLKTSVAAMRWAGAKTIVMHRGRESDSLSALEEESSLHCVEDTISEQDARLKLLRVAKATGARWILTLDHDETLLVIGATTDDERRALLARLLNPLNPATKVYATPVHVFWRGSTHVRIDGHLGEYNPRYLFKNEPCWGEFHTSAGEYPIPRTPSYIADYNTQFTAVLAIERRRYTDPDRALAAVEEAKAAGQKAKAGYLSQLLDETQLSLVPHAPPTLALVMLAKNEQDHVTRLLRDYRELVHEVVILETGSTDNTAARALEFGATVVKYRCCEHAEEPDHLICDFAAARNAAIDLVTSQYILFLDPDEEVARHTLSLLSYFLLRRWDGYMCTIHNLGADPTQTKILRTQQPRLFRRCPEIRYDDECHETLENAFRRADGKLGLGLSSILIYHFGFLETDPKARAKKNAAYAQRLTEMIQKNPENARALFHLAVHLHSIGEFDQGDELLLRSVMLAPEVFGSRWTLAMRLAHRAADLILATPGGLIPDDEQGQAARRMVLDLAKFYPDVARRCNVVPLPGA